ncbi:MAG: aldo/keto reductase, partial [Candidatus Aminicenantes bacterium]|nr:aldo/keto reductase [Candidatus Aminicenantes bacterium]
MSKTKGMNRRSFIKQSTFGLIGGGLMSQTGVSRTQQEAEADSPKIKEYRTLGRTGFKISDLGTGDFDDVGPFRGLLDAGVNYIDTSETYGQHGRKIGEAIKGRDRSSLFISSKLMADTSIRRIRTTGINKEGFIKRSLRVMEALQIDYLDCLMISSPETVEMLKTQGFHEATEQLKKEGKIRFVGVSHHGSQWWMKKPKEPMEKILLAAAEDGRFDVMLLAYNFLKEDMSERVLEVCGQKNIGTTLMKTNPIRSYNYMKQWLERSRYSKGKELSDEEKENVARMEKKVENAQEFIQRYHLKSDKEIRDAAIRFVLSNPNVHTVCVTVLNYEEMRDYLNLSGSRLTPEDTALLSAYKKECGSLYCRHACGLCEPECPHRVPVNTIMRYDHYFVSQGREKHAMEKYAALKSRKADRCQNCRGYCESACPYGVPVQSLLAAA